MGLENGTARKSLGDLVFERMHRAIKSGAYKPDERLPTEHDLANEFEVSRPIVREALRRLREQGFIYSRRGAGSFVRAVGMREPLGFGQLENVADLLNCYEFRLTVEPAAAAAAAERHDAATLAAIRQALELMRDATNRQSHREDADFQFHLAIARAAQNSYFFTAMEALKDHIAVGMRFHGASVKRETTGLTRVFAEHEAIAEAIAAREAAKARQLMHDHLAGSRERLFQATK
ncbi:MULTISPECIES: FCD domain-containing protein [unclassified Ensifer]|uniref:FadR/GntR family transcriptional regulator n=1 Tax=unclassified Ensifer TaxID=2633371 RepID=UPI000812E6FF|nr:MULTISPECIES: FCD domain-containing protein [unclassified Ensifer]OCP10049.1 GntR family transcriptional regulator [Ensifer sp. LC14]OCP12288.1 GntR family transcriptional regulator [Ensifer sp. LC13]OCP13104.1 GntR family transcriptional regulator [Ensifer sp. LC11]OCP33849.1 GntR family transcriptional regulator [Ensifer sp. LC499]